MSDSPVAPRTRRRRPMQARSERRVQSILDAAAKLLAEVGYDRLTLTGVAEHSDSGIGSIYHFFSDKDQLFDALIERITAEIRELPAFVLRPSLARVPIETFASELIEPLAAFGGRHPELPELMRHLPARNPGIDSDITRRLDAIISERAPSISRTERTAIVALTKEIVRNGIALVATSPKRSRRAMIEELKYALKSYLGARLDHADKVS